MKEWKWEVGGDELIEVEGGTHKQIIRKRVSWNNPSSNQKTAKIFGCISFSIFFICCISKTYIVKSLDLNLKDKDNINCCCSG